MSENELEKIKGTGKVQAGDGDQTHVTIPADPNAFKDAEKGSVFVEFDVPSGSVAPGGKEGWGIISGPNSVRGRLAKKKGDPIPVMPEAENIEVTMRK